LPPNAAIFIAQQPRNHFGLAVAVLTIVFIGMALDNSEFPFIIENDFQ